MVKKFNIPCNFGGQMSPVTLCIGEPKEDQHPLNFQAKWISGDKGGQIPQDVMDSIQKLYNLAKKNNVVFEDLCFYAINVANGSIENNNTKFSGLLEQLS